MSHLLVLSGDLEYLDTLHDGVALLLGDVKFLGLLMLMVRDEVFLVPEDFVGGNRVFNPLIGVDLSSIEGFETKLWLTGLDLVGVAFVLSDDHASTVFN